MIAEELFTEVVDTVKGILKDDVPPGWKLIVMRDWGEPEMFRVFFDVWGKDGSLRKKATSNFVFPLDEYQELSPEEFRKAIHERAANSIKDLSALVEGWDVITRKNEAQLES